MLTPSPTLSASRLGRITRARQIALRESAPLVDGLIEPWIAQSWQRCLSQGLRPEHHVAFEAVSAQLMRQAAEANRPLIQAARPILSQLGRAIADTRYFAILTNHEGVVVDVDGPIDRGDRRAAVITRIGVDLSEKSVGTTAIGAALRELQPVWLHRGEHFFNDTSIYSCAGAPLFGPDGRCAGMLDLTGVEAAERPELRHLVTHCARSIENAMVLQRSHMLSLRLNWPGFALGDDSDGLLTLDADGHVSAANRAARLMLPEIGKLSQPHCRDVFALPFDMLVDAARRAGPDIEVPLWSGLRLVVRCGVNGKPVGAGGSSLPPRPAVPGAADAGQPLREVETALILKAVEQARGNVAQAARVLGISRATVYRKLGGAKR
jgi:transcriptional regulator of acetoin/glycerol metabolism